MGILDEAIREHLDLKRQHGAEGDELKRLEDEAFGPPTRPGEPDFPEAEVADLPTGEADLPTGEEEAPTTVVGAEPSVAPPEDAGQPEAPAEEAPPA